MVAGSTQKGEDQQPKLVTAPVEGAGQVEPTNPVAPRYKRRGHGP